MAAVAAVFFIVSALSAVCAVSWRFSTSEIFLQPREQMLKSNEMDFTPCTPEQLLLIEKSFAHIR